MQRRKLFLTMSCKALMVIWTLMSITTCSAFVSVNSVLDEGFACATLAYSNIKLTAPAGVFPGK
jgi:hypothetical protein